MIITEIYDKFRINKGLREHMLRVASVTQIICDNSTTGLETDKIVSAALVHDLGNIVKTKFENGPELFEPEGVAYYEQVQKEVIEKYGSDDHDVTLAMLAELHINDEIAQILEATGLLNIPTVFEEGDAAEKIMMYSDLRVGFFGIVTLDARFDDLKERYTPHRYTIEVIENGRKMMKEMETEIFANSKIKSEHIVDEITTRIQRKLLHYQIL